MPAPDGPTTATVSPGATWMVRARPAPCCRAGWDSGSRPRRRRAPRWPACGRRYRRGGSADLGLGGDQFGEAPGRARAAKKIAIDFAQGGERAADQHAGEDEGGDLAAGHAARGNVDRAFPDDHHDGAEHQRDQHHGHDRAQPHPGAGGGEGAFDHIGEAGLLAALLAERLHDLHRAQHFADVGADIGDPVLAGAGEGADLAAEQDDRAEQQGNGDQQQPGKLGAEREQIDDPADPGDEVAQRERDRGADHLLQHRGVGGEARGDLARPVFLEEAWRQGEEVALHLAAKVGNGALAQPRHEIEAETGGDRQHHDDHQQILERLGHRSAADRAAREAAVDDLLEAIRDGERRRRTDARKNNGGEDPRRVSSPPP